MNDERSVKYLRVVDQAGNGQDYPATFVPHIGERIVLERGTGGEPVRRHYFRVKDVMYRLDNPVEHQVGVLVEEDANPEDWPS